jgi:hypothetical protein
MSTKRLGKLTNVFIISLAVLSPLSTYATLSSSAPAQCRKYSTSETATPPTQAILEDAVVGVVGIENPSPQQRQDIGELTKRLFAYLKTLPNVNQSNLQRTIAKAFIDASLGKILEPVLSAELAKFTGKWAVAKVDVGLNSSLLAIDLAYVRPDISLGTKALAMAATMSITSAEKRLYLGADPITQQQQITQLSTMSPTVIVAQNIPLAVMDLATPFAANLVADHVTSLVCTAAGVPVAAGTVVFLGTGVVSTIACLTAAEYMKSTAKQGYTDIINVLNSEGVKGLFNKACKTRLGQGAIYAATLTVTSFVEINRQITNLWTGS